MWASQRQESLLHLVYAQSPEHCLALGGAQGILVELNEWEHQDPKRLSDFFEFTQLIVTDAGLHIGALLTMRCEAVIQVISTNIPSSFFLVNSYLNFSTHFFQQMIAKYLISYILITASMELLVGCFHTQM